MWSKGIYCSQRNKYFGQNLCVFLYIFQVFIGLFLHKDMFVCTESTSERTGRRRSMPGSSEKTTASVEAASITAAPFRVTVSTVSSLWSVICLLQLILMIIQIYLWIEGWDWQTYGLKRLVDWWFQIDLWIKNPCTDRSKVSQSWH